MELKTILRNWKIMLPTAGATATALLWVLGMEFPRPVLAAEYRSDLKTLNVQQIQIRKDFLEDKLQRVDAELLHLKREAYQAQQIGDVPEYLPELQQKVEQEKEELEQTLDAVHKQEIQLMNKE